MILWLAITLIGAAFIIGFILGMFSGAEINHEPDSDMRINGDI